MTPKPKKKPYRSEAYLDFIRAQPCYFTGKKPAEAAHVRDASNSGTSTKPHDTYAVPLSHEKHIDEEHQKGKQTFWNGINEYMICLIYLSKYITQKKKKDFKCILLMRLFCHLEKELNIDPFDLIFRLYGEWIIKNPGGDPNQQKKKVISLLFNHLSKTENIDPYRLSIELMTDYLQERHA